MSRRRWGSRARVDSIDTGKKKLLKAAITCFVSKGVNATTIEDIANAANVTRRTVYRYYGGKAELIDAVVELERRRLFGEMQEACAPFQGDFPRMVEECLACAASVLSPAAGKAEMISGSEFDSSLPDMCWAVSRREWRSLLGDAYRQYRKAHPEIGDLQDITEVLSRLVLSFRYTPIDKQAVREAIRAFLSLKMPHTGAALQLA